MKFKNILKISTLAFTLFALGSCSIGKPNNQDNIPNNNLDSDNIIGQNKLDSINSYKGESEVDKFMDDFMLAEHDFQENYANKTNVDTPNLTNFKNKYGEKFFFNIYASNLDSYDTLARGFKELSSYPEKYVLKGPEFKLISFCVNENGEKDHLDEYVNLSVYSTIFNNHTDFFKNIYDSGVNSLYYASNMEEPLNLQFKLRDVTANGDFRLYNLIIVVDLTSANKGKHIMSQVIDEIMYFGDEDLAKNLRNAWNYEGRLFKLANS